MPVDTIATLTGADNGNYGFAVLNAATGRHIVYTATNGRTIRVLLPDGTRRDFAGEGGVLKLAALNESGLLALYWIDYDTRGVQYLSTDIALGVPVGAVAGPAGPPGPPGPAGPQGPAGVSSVDSDASAKLGDYLVPDASVTVRNHLAAIEAQANGSRADAQYLAEQLRQLASQIVLLERAIAALGEAKP